MEVELQVVPNLLLGSLLARDSVSLQYQLHLVSIFFFGERIASG
jgi:hypothetical protein